MRGRKPIELTEASSGTVKSYPIAIGHLHRTLPPKVPCPDRDCIGTGCGAVDVLTSPQFVPKALQPVGDKVDALAFALHAPATVIPGPYNLEYRFK